ncbi:HVO_2922 family protein [Halosegnis sp.]|uniref:HVO_2922 family protein n=1 Tax=Halosegnis sp. TaxID=2864959 RepID=UPI0035D5261C
MPSDDYETEFTASHTSVAALLSGLTDGVLAGAVRVGDDGPTVETPASFDVELEFERDDGTASLEVELEWDEPVTEGVRPDTAETVPEAADVSDTAAATDAATEALAESADDEPAVAADAPLDSLARFELFHDRGDEWRWRLRHRNGNIIATSGEGYTRKHNARKGLASVVANAPGAAVHEPE